MSAIWGPMLHNCILHTKLNSVYYKLQSPWADYKMFEENCFGLLNVVNVILGNQHIFVDIWYFIQAGLFCVSIFGVTFWFKMMRLVVNKYYKQASEVSILLHNFMVVIIARPVWKLGFGHVGVATW